MTLDTIYNEDCLIGMKKIPDASIDAVICDLPYGTTRNQWDSVIPLDKLWEQYKRIIKPAGAIVLFSQQPFTSALVMSNPQMFRYEWIWQKDNGTGFLNANRMPLKIHENIAVFYDALPTYNPQGLIYHPKKAKRGATGSNYGTTSNEYETDYENYPKDLLQFKSDPDAWHPTQKPVDLLRYLILTYTNMGGVVLDNCSGSGTTAVACVKEKRHFICFEKDENYWRKSVERVKNVQAQLTLF